MGEPLVVDRPRKGVQEVEQYPSRDVLKEQGLLANDIESTAPRRQLEALLNLDRTLLPQHKEELFPDDLYRVSFQRVQQQLAKWLEFTRDYPRVSVRARVVEAPSSVDESAPGKINRHEAERVIQVLENPKHVWRTFDGIMAESRLDEKTVAAVLWKLRGDVVMASRLSTTGKELFTTRKHFRESASPWQKLVGALKNRVS